LIGLHFRLISIAFVAFRCSGSCCETAAVSELRGAGC
jgi:hypothetical protein